MKNDKIQKLYYIAPSDESFNHLKEKAREVWCELAISPCYLKEKTDRLD